MKEKEESGTLARNDGIGDEWTFYKLILKLVRGVPDIPQVLLQNLQAIVGHVVQDYRSQETLYQG